MRVDGGKEKRTCMSERDWFGWFGYLVGWLVAMMMAMTRLLRVM
jgi:hypothetical protein